MTGRRGESWQRRIPNTGYDPNIWSTLASPHIWVNVMSPQLNNDTTEDNTETTTSDSASTITPFELLTTGNKFKLIRSIVTPLNANTNRNGSVAIQVKYEDVEMLINTKKIKETPVEIKKDQYKNLIRGKIKNTSVITSTEEEIIEELHEINCIKAQKLEVPKRDSEKNIVRDKDNKLVFEYSGEAIITLELETIPLNKVSFFHSKIQVKQHEPDPVLCRQCYKYRHTKKRCENPIGICGYCSKASHTTFGQKCNNPPMCMHCHKNNNQCDHPIFSKKCPYYNREKEILLIKEIKKVPYPVAENILDKRLNSQGNEETPRTNETNFITINNQESLTQKVETIGTQSAAIHDTLNKLQATIENLNTTVTRFLAMQIQNNATQTPLSSVLARQSNIYSSASSDYMDLIRKLEPDGEEDEEDVDEDEGMEVSDSEKRKKNKEKKRKSGTPRGNSKLARHTHSAFRPIGEEPKNQKEKKPPDHK